MTYPTTTRPGLGRPLLVGTLIALVLIAALAVWAFTGGEFQLGGDDVNDAIVVLVLPDEDGTLIPRTITRLGIDADAATTIPIDHVDPRSPAIIPGTTYSELRDAYPFGGGALLARILTETTGTADTATAGNNPGSDARQSAHVILDMDALRTVAMGRTAAFDLEIPEHMEVFDGERLFTFEEGAATVTLDELPALFAGAEYLSAAEREIVRVQVAEEIISLLRGGGTQLYDAVETDLSADRYAEFVSK
ncbi:MAG: hypothetical protein U1E29_00755 [Coriobacteriia bacterium]|nr:hypothetical protein [Coriobacteriia bacterium]